MFPVVPIEMYHSGYNSSTKGGRTVEVASAIGHNTRRRDAKPRMVAAIGIPIIAVRPKHEPR